MDAIGALYEAVQKLFHPYLPLLVQEHGVQNNLQIVNEVYLE